MQRTWPLAVGTWWAKLIDIFIFFLCRLCHLGGILIISSKLFHCRLVRTVELDWVTVQYVVNRSETVSGCSLGDGEPCLDEERLSNCLIYRQLTRNHLPHPNKNQMSIRLHISRCSIKKNYSIFWNSVPSSDIISLYVNYVRGESIIS